MIKSLLLYPKSGDQKIPTRIRIDLAGYHHIINRGVDKMNVFLHDEDKEMFLQILNQAFMLHKVVLHDYYLMDNHYQVIYKDRKRESFAQYLGLSKSHVSKVLKKVEI